MKRTLSILFLLLLAVPPGLGFHEDEAVGARERPEVSREPLMETDVVPVDRAQRDALTLVDETFGFGYDRLQETILPVLESAPHEPLILYRDGIGHDAATGVMGSWRQVGHDAWAPAPGAAKAGNGEWVFTSANQPGGRYLMQADSLLVTPELDLRTGFDFDGRTRAPDWAPTAVPRQPVDPWSSLAPAMGPLDLKFQLDFDFRHNLGANRDKVEVWVLEKSAYDALGEQLGAAPSCGSGCTKLPASYTGKMVDWMRATVDLTPWAEQRVWVAFHFVSKAAPAGDDYFSRASFFDTQAGWYGFQLDNLALRGTVPPLNMQAHEPHSPSHRLPGHSLPAVDIDAPIVVQAFLRNTGNTAFDVQPRVRLLVAGTGSTTTVPGPLPDAPDEVPQPPGGATVPQIVIDEEDPDVVPGSERTLPTIHLEPGEARQVTATYPAFGSNAALVAEVQGVRVGQAGRVPDSDAGDDVARLAFEVLRTRSLSFDGPSRQNATLPLGDGFLNVTGTLRNDGTASETVTLLAQLLDVRNGYAPADDLLLLQDQEQTVVLGPGQTESLTWHVDASLRPGQYRLFVRTAGEPPFEASDLIEPKEVGYEVPYADGPVTVDGTLSETAWGQALSRTVKFSTPGGSEHDVTLRLFHDGSFLYAAVTVPDPTEDTAVPDDEDSFTLLFDDLGDGVLLDGGEDGIEVGDQASAEGMVEADLAYNTLRMEWLREGLTEAQAARSAANDAARQYDQSVVPSVYRYELRRPIAGAGMDVLAGGFLDFYALLGETLAAGGKATYHYPSDGITRDGAALTEANGNLGDEVAGTWARLHLAPLPATPLPTEIRRLSDGFGIGMGPPLPFLLDVSDGCPVTWGLEGAQGVAGTTGVDRWNCAFYPPAGRTLLYEGMEPSASCASGPCLPFSAAYNYPRTSSTKDAVLSTPPIQIPATAEAPVLILSHQYATEVLFGDAAVPEDGSPPSGSTIQVNGIAWVTAQIRNPDGSWGSDIYLVPERGYSTEESNLLDNPGRDFLTKTHGATTTVFCDEGGIVASPNSRRPPPVPTPNCGWWSPVGASDGYRPKGETLPLGGVFPGSPWTVDRIPLYGMHSDHVNGRGDRSVGSHPVGDLETGLAGKTVRFRFHLARDHALGLDVLDPANDPLKELGWRIEAVAVAEGPPVRDAAVGDLRVTITSYDPKALGLGPGTAIPLEANVTNLGPEPLEEAQVRFEGIDVSADGAVVCQRLAPVGVTLAPQEVATVKASCELPAAAEGSVVVFRASAVLPGGDDQPLNDVATLAGLDVRSSPDAALEVSVTPVSASSEWVRSIHTEVRNLGNVPIGSFRVQQTLLRNEDSVRSPGWDFEGPLPVGESWTLSDPRLTATPELTVADRFFDPEGKTGALALMARLSGVDGDVDASNDLEKVSFHALDRLYANGFEGTVTAKPGVVQGALSFEGTPLWTVVGDPLDPAAHVLRAGDPTTGEMPPLADARALLPSLDLTAARDASLVLTHDYDLERGYDAARLELSTDGGQSWEAIEPHRTDASTPGAGGYPDVALVGQNPLGGSTGSAFTGTSQGDDGTVRVVSEFDLGQADSLQEATTFAKFDLQDLQSKPEPAPITNREGDRFFTDPTWHDEGQDLSGWLVENVTFNDPKPHSGSRMWWSGNSGTVPDDVRRIDTSLRLPIDLTGPSRGTAGSPEAAVVSWWDWRAGWRDRELEGDREGTGGRFQLFVHAAPGSLATDSDQDGLANCQETGYVPRGTVPNNPPSSASPGNPYLTGENTAAAPGCGGLKRYHTSPTVADSDGDGVPDGDEVLVPTNPTAEASVVFPPADLLQALVEREESGWSRREVDLSRHLGHSLVLEFRYMSALGAEDGQFFDPAFKNNEGWFLDDLGATRYVLQEGARTQPKAVPGFEQVQALDADGFVSTDCAPIGLFTVRRNTVVFGAGEEAEETPSAACWSLVDRAEHHDGAWHLETVPGPGGQPVRAWRMSDDSGQGYPNQANSRLITPPIDLTQVVGASATLRFDHRYGLEATLRNGFILPGDAGVVEVQEFDEATGRYGPWRLLADGPLPERLVVDGNGQTTSLTGMLTPQAFEGTGYNALYDRGTFHAGATAVVGVGSPFDPMDGICRQCSVLLDNQGNSPFSLHPLTPAFSGDSGGWQEADWDVSSLIGKRVRFAFHAWSNPQDTTSREATLEGWSVANVEVSGKVFHGQPVLLRLRAGTDGSLLDGHWSIADLEASGVLHGRSLALEGQGIGGAIAIPTAAAPELHFQVQNRGTESRPGLALAVTARANGLPVAAELVDPQLEEIPEADRLSAPPVDKAWGDFILTPVGTQGGIVDATVRLLEPPTGTDIEVLVQVLEDHGEDRPVDGVLVHFPSFKTPSDDLKGGTEALAVLRIEDTSVPELRPAGQGSDALVQVDPGTGDAVAFKAAVANAGTVEATYTVGWRILSGTTQVWSSGETFALAPGPTKPLAAQATLPGPGVYTLQLTVTEPGGGSAVHEVDFPFKASAVLRRQAFDGLSGPLPEATSPLPAGWSRSGTDSDAAAFRFRNGALVWGLNPGADGGYCDLLDGCQSAGGYEGMAVLAPIDVTDPPNGRVELSVLHAVDLMERQDGARVEATIVEPNGSGGWIPRTCSRSGQPNGPDWVPLRPTDGLLHNGVTGENPQQGGQNPLDADTPVFQGAVGSVEQPVASHYDLSVQDAWCLGGTPASGIPLVGPEGAPPAGKALAVRYHVGIESRVNKEDQRGWVVDETTLASARVLLGPKDDRGQRELAIARNVPKLFPFSVTNDGPASQTFRLSLVFEEPTAQPWATLQEDHLRLAPGATGTAWLSVTIPERFATGTQKVLLKVASDDPAVLGEPLTDNLPVLLRVGRLNKADLAVELVEPSEKCPQPAPAKPCIEQGDILSLSANVTNHGQRPSKATTIRFEAIDLRHPGVPLAIETLTVPALCAPGTDGCEDVQDARTVVTAEWSVPDLTGDYRLLATVNPDGRLPESSLDDNVASLEVKVVPMQLPNLVVESLTVDGVGPDGAVEEGALLAIHATVANKGETPIASSQLRILAGSVTVTQADLPLLVKGARATVDAFKVATAGEDGQVVLKAVALATSGLESRVDDNEMRRLLIVRTHDLSAEGPAGPVPGAPGLTLSTTVTLRNAGNGVERVATSVEGLPKAWTASVLPAEVAVPPGGTALAVVLFTVPEDAGGGDWPATFVAKAPAATARANLTVRLSASTAPPDVRMAEDSLHTGPSTVSLKLASPSNIAQEVLLEPAEGSLWAFPPTRVSLAPLEATSLVLPVDIPGAAPSGPVTLGLAASALDGSWSKDYSFEADVLPTLRASTQWVETRTGQPQGDGTRTVLLSVEVNNTGNVPFRATPEGRLADGSRLGQAPSVRLEPGDSARMELPLLVDEEAASPTGEVAFLLEAEGANEDLVQALALTIPELEQVADLTLVSAAVQGGARAGSKVIVAFEVENAGLAPSPPSSVHAYLDGLLVGSAPVPALQPGERHAGEIGLAAVAGDHVLTVVADGAQRVLESHEDNNGRSMALEVEGAGWFSTAARKAPGAGPLWVLAALGAAWALAARRRGA